MPCTYRFDNQVHDPTCRVEHLLGCPPRTLGLTRNDAIESLRAYSRSLRDALPNASDEESFPLRTRLESNELSIDYMIRNR